jgi:hypothetical protein
MAFMNNKNTIPTTSGITAETCGRCGRLLKNQKSRNKGFGPKCFRKWKADGHPVQTEIDEFLE